MKRRVVITGVGLVSPLGNDLDTVTAALAEGRTGVRTMDEWTEYGGVETRLGAPAQPYSLAGYSRKQLRTMGPVARHATFATAAAIADAGLPEELVRSGRVGLAYGSTDGSCSSEESYYRKLYATNSFSGLLASSYLKFMSHTCAANLAQLFGITGRVVPICSACTSASQSIGQGYEALAFGREEVMICGGAEELHFTVAGVFDLMLATSVRYNAEPARTPRPFDADRDGMVVGEGAGTLVLETLEGARARGATIHAEIVGYGTNCDGGHLTSPSDRGMAGAMARALADAALDRADIGYINAHGTGTEVGDRAESRATYEVMGGDVPISSTKSYTGHTLGSCGAIESAFIFGMMRDGFLAPTRTLDAPDPECGPLNYLMGTPREAKPELVMNNNFAFGGINTSLIYRRPDAI